MIWDAPESVHCEGPALDAASRWKIALKMTEVPIRAIRPIEIMSLINERCDVLINTINYLRLRFPMHIDLTDRPSRQRCRFERNFSM